MSFLNPICLFGLLPWGALTLWLLWGRRPRVAVPFVVLWQISAVDVHARRNLQTPPIAVALIILSLLLGILAAAGPLLHVWGRSSDVPINVVLDRGASMSARTRDGSTYRFEESAKTLSAQLVELAGRSLPVRLIDLGDGSEQTLRADKLSAAVDARSPTLVNTRDAMRRALLQASRDTTKPWIIITDQSLENRRDNIVRIGPTQPVRNVSIVELAIRRSPASQIMVGIRNDGVSPQNAMLRLTSGDWRHDESIALPTTGSVRNYFFDADRLGEVTRAQLVGIADDFPPDNQKAVAREGNAARIDARAAIPPAMKRLLNAYRAHRATVNGFAVVAIVDKSSALSAMETGLVLDMPSEESPTTIGPLTTQSHPILQSLSFASLPKVMAISLDAPPWTPIISAGEHVLVAARQEPARQIWVGFDPSEWAASPDFVVFFSGCFDWLVAGGERDTSHPSNELTSGWHPFDVVHNPAFAGDEPGVYRSDEGTLRAFQLSNVSFGSDPRQDMARDVAHLVASRRPGLKLDGALLEGALICLLGAAFTWRRHRVYGDLLLGHETPADASSALD